MGEEKKKKTISRKTIMSQIINKSTPMSKLF